MRLSPQDVTHIKQVFLSFDSEVIVYLFGSRVDDNKRGGDIDLLVLSQKISRKDIIKARGMLAKGLGEQKIDIVLTQTGAEPLASIAMNEGILL